MPSSCTVDGAQSLQRMEFGFFVLENRETLWLRIFHGVAIVVVVDDVDDHAVV